jgi:hypothetical protein
MLLSVTRFWITCHFRSAIWPSVDSAFIATALYSTQEYVEEGGGAYKPVFRYSFGTMVLGFTALLPYFWGTDTEQVPWQ